MKYTVANIFQTSLADGERALDRRAGSPRRVGDQGLESWKTRPMH